MIVRQLLTLLATIMVSLSLLSLFGCRDGGLPDGEAVQIRISNVSDKTITRVWLGSGEQNGATATTRFGRIRPNSLSDYRSMAPVLANYNFADLRVDGEMMLSRNINPAAVLGTDLQAGGKYTYIYDIVDGKAQLINITQD